MRDAIPDDLRQTLEDLQLATPGQIRAAAGAARRLAGELPLFASVWIDALAETRVLTPLQAARLHDHAQRTERAVQLRAGPFLLERELEPVDVGRVYLARRQDGVPGARQAKPLWSGGFKCFGRGDVSRACVLSAVGDVPAETAAQACDRLLVQLAALRSLNQPWPFACGVNDRQLWLAAPPIAGTSAARWLLHHGRMPADMVVEIARQMAAIGRALEDADLVHGNIGLRQIVLHRRGEVQLTWPGVRAILFPDEGFGHCPLPPWAYDGFAPELCSQTRRRTPASDIYAYGCTWWHLLTGRSAATGGDALAKLQAAQEGRRGRRSAFADVRNLAPDVPPRLAETLAACMQPRPEDRPGSFAEVLRALQPPASRSHAVIRRRMRRPRSAVRLWHSLPETQPQSPAPLKTAAILGAAVMLGGLLWWGGSATTERNASPSHELAANGADSRTDVAGAALEKPFRERSDQAKTVVAQPVGQRTQLPVADDRILKGFPTESPGDGPSRRLYAQPASHKAANENVLELPADEVVSAEQLVFRPGMRVRSAGGRARIAAAAGLLVEHEGIVFEGVDFVVADSPVITGDSHGSPRGAISALIEVRAAEVRFVDCGFYGSARTGASAAVAWHFDREGDERSREAVPVQFPTGSLSLESCVLYGVAAGVDVVGDGASNVQVHHSLHLGPGPLLRMRVRRRIDEQTRLVIRQSTVRNASAVLEWRFREADLATEGDSDDAYGGRTLPRLASCEIQAAGSVFASTAGLILLTGPISPEALTSAIAWSGEGSVLAEESETLAWRSGANLRPLDESRLHIGGLVRSRLEFAGPAEQGPQASRLVGCQAPLRGDRLPGIGGPTSALLHGVSDDDR